MNFVLDSSVILAFLFNEPGGTNLLELLEFPCVLNSVNFSEVLIKLKSRGMLNDKLRLLIEQSGIEIIAWDSAMAWMAQELNIPFGKGLSLADQVCITTAAYFKCPVVTADTLWSTLSLPVEVKLIR